MHACISSCITSMVSKQFFSFFFSSLLLITSLFLFLFLFLFFLLRFYYNSLFSHFDFLPFFFFFFNTFQRTSISILYFIILHLKCILILYTRERKKCTTFTTSYLYDNLLFIRQVRNYLPWIIFFFLQFSLYDEMEFSFSHNYFFFFIINDRK